MPYYLIQTIILFAKTLWPTFFAGMMAQQYVDGSNVFYNSLAHSLIFVLLTHFVIRQGFKKWQNKLRSTKFSLLIILVLTFLAVTLDLFSNQPINSLFPVETSAVVPNQTLELAKEQAPVSKQSIKVATVLGSLLFYLFWSMCYLAITISRDKKQTIIELQAHQLKSLMAQINPHFLFNSMNTIRGMIYEDKDKAAELLTELSELFRYNLSAGTKTAASLKEELEICQSYLNIERIRLGDRLRVNLKIAPNTLGSHLPGMGLLILVENAIKHGIAPLPQGGELVLETKIENKQVCVRVANPYLADHMASGTKTGLYNLDKRLELMFGPMAELRRVKTATSFQVELRYPYAN